MNFCNFCGIRLRILQIYFHTLVHDAYIDTKRYTVSRFITAAYDMQRNSLDFTHPAADLKRKCELQWSRSMRRGYLLVKPFTALIEESTSMSQFYVLLQLYVLLVKPCIHHAKRKAPLCLSSMSYCSLCLTGKTMHSPRQEESSSMSLTSDLILNMPVRFGTRIPTERYICWNHAVQKFALRVCSKQWDASYSMLCSTLNLPTLAARRKQMKLSVMYKILNGLTDFPNVPISARDNPFDLRSLAPHTLLQRQTASSTLFFLTLLNSGMHYHLMWLWQIITLLF